MSEMKEMIIESASKMFEKYSTKEAVNESEKGVWAGDLWNSLAENGMLTVAVPEELGGSGGDYDDALSILRLAGKYSAPIPLAETYMANWLLAKFDIPVGNDILTVAYEKNMQPFQFNKDGEGFVVTGKAKNVPWARYADKLIVLGETSDGTIFSLLDLKDAQINQGKNMAGEARDEVIFDHVFVNDPVNRFIGRDDFEKTVLYSGALTKSVLMAGALEKILEVTINHTNERNQFGRPLHRFQAIQHHIAHLAGESASAGLAASYAVDSFEKDPFSKEIALAKIRVNEAAGKGNPIAHQVLAAIGFTYEHTLHHSTRRLWSWRDEFGTESEWEEVVTDELLNLDKDGLWSLITGVENYSKEVEVK
ncbi:acyl-CoA dehydrogenase family protein [Bacillus dakarensis]|uniref:acyl-CoA dehydrogenase family protein n=1 Tax=Robertmurraya dakarensis TaxID=1926278 RepID=UPI0009818A00|nr:acyl-CoA dehydrogenase family protein [Bacillus dakarensis]